MRKPLLVTIAVLALAAAGCAGIEQRTPRERVAHAAAQMGEVSSARFEMTMTTSGAAQIPEGYAVTGHGTTEPAAQRMHLVMDLGDMVPPEEREAIPGQDLTMEMIQDGLVTYTRTGMATGERWVRMDAEQMGLDPAELQAMGSPMGGGDPTMMLDSLRALAGDVTEVGTEDVRGEPTTHYRFTIDMDRALADLEPQTRERLRQMSPYIALGEIPTEVWIDADDRIRRMRQVVDLAQAGPPFADQGGTFTTTIELLDFGAAEPIELPPAELVDDFSDVYGDMGQGFGADFSDEVYVEEEVQMEVEAVEEEPAEAP